MSRKSATVGVDVGSITTKAVALAGEGWESRLIATGPSPKKAAARAVEELLAAAGLERAQVARLVATGYGRARVEGADRKITEITCHARGAEHLAPGVDMVVDIGGQDSKVIKTDGAGGVVDFTMNDKCAAGTGRFLEVMAGALESRVEELGEMAKGAEPVEITSMCTVFAESEVISLLAEDVPCERVVAGIHRSVARRVASMAQRLGLGQRILFTGGVAKNSGVRRALEQALGREVVVHEHCQLAGALGAALLAADQAGA
jgi:predicted CoA-substrate-specific enzyme activase